MDKEPMLKQKQEAHGKGRLSNTVMDQRESLVPGVLTQELYLRRAY